MEEKNSKQDVKKKTKGEYKKKKKIKNEEFDPGSG